MEIEIKAVGGFEEVGRNMVFLRIDDEAVIIDMGLHVDKITTFCERENPYELPIERLYEIDALPDDRILEPYKDMVKAIAISHGHLDHVAGVPFLAAKYNCPIYCTPYTAKVLESILEDAGIVLPNEIKKISPNSSVKISDKIEIEFVHVTHSIPQAAIINIKTPAGNIVYACDFKFDNHPIIGKTSNIKRLKEIGKEGVIALLVESTRVDEESKTPSEVIARYMLEDVMKGLEHEGGLIVTTFSSHIARLKSIFDISWEIDRTPVFLGRSLYKYIKAAEDLNFVDFSSKTDVLGDPKSISRKLKEINEKRDKYVLVVTGHQGEPGSVLDRMARGELPWEWKKEDTVIFSNNVIPYPTNIANRQILENRLRKHSVKIIKDVHVSGHSRKEDHRYLLRILKPHFIFPMHGDWRKRAAYVELAMEEGYEFGEEVILLQNGQSKIIKI